MLRPFSNTQYAMAGFLDALRSLGNMGLAHTQHVQALRSAILDTDMQRARDGLTHYVQGLSDAAWVGFQTSLAIVLQSETQASMRQSLQWLAANVEGFRDGRFLVPTAQQLVSEDLDDTRLATLLASWMQGPAGMAEQQLQSSLAAMPLARQRRLARQLDTLAKQTQSALQLLKTQTQQQANNSAHNPKAWGSSVEDQIAYSMAHLRAGSAQPRPQPAQDTPQNNTPQNDAPQITALRSMVQRLQQMAHTARATATPTATEAGNPRKPNRQTKQPAPPTPAEQLQAAARAGAGPKELLALLREQLATEAQHMDPARVAALQEQLKLTEDMLRRGDDINAGDKPNASTEEQRAQLQKRMAHVSAARQQIEQMRELQRNVRRPPAQDEPAAQPPGKRAAAIRPLLDALVDSTAGLCNTALPAAREAEHELTQQLHSQLVAARATVHELAASDANVLAYERDSLRQTVHALRLHHRRGHLMLARPIWPGGAARVESGTALLMQPSTASADIHEAIVRACSGASLCLCEPQAPGVDIATSQSTCSVPAW